MLTGGAPLVSIVMPAYNAAPWIEAAIASTRAQTEPSFELLVVDDGSSDTTAEIVRHDAAFDRRIRLLTSPCNSGPAAARNRGLAQARGDFVALLDADDRYDPNRLAHLLELARAHDADMVSDNLMLCAAATPEVCERMIPEALLPRPCRLSAAEFVERNIGSRRYPRVSFGFMQPLFRRTFLKKHGLLYDERNRFGEDFLLYLDCLMHGAEWWVTPEPLYLYTVRPGSLTEVQTSGDLGRIREIERDLLDDPRVFANHDLCKALRRHQKGIARRYHYRAFTDALKSRSYARAAGLLFDSSESIRSITREGLAQTPVIAAKAWRGGYRNNAAPPAAGLVRPHHP